MAMGDIKSQPRVIALLMTPGGPKAMVLKPSTNKRHEPYKPVAFLPKKGLRMNPSPSGTLDCLYMAHGQKHIKAPARAVWKSTGARQIMPQAITACSQRVIQRHSGISINLSLRQKLPNQEPKADSKAPVESISAIWENR